jgi:CHAT domain-containing protein
MHNGDHFLVEDYGIALTPGLQLVDPQPIQQQELSVLTAGLSEARQGFSALPNVIPEVQQIQQEISAELLLNQDFTTNAIQQLVQDSADPIVHMATHGKFSSQKDETFILTWDGQLNINQLNSLLQASELNREAPIELLVLSACQTATGDKQAALGLAGVAVRAGARSTVATLWQVNDEGTAIFMSRFYEELTDQNVSKAEALRRAQLAILEDPQFRQHPYFWAPYVLIGNWL